MVLLGCKVQVWLGDDGTLVKIIQEDVKLSVSAAGKVTVMNPAELRRSVVLKQRVQQVLWLILLLLAQTSMVYVLGRAVMVADPCIFSPFCALNTLKMKGNVVLILVGALQVLMDILQTMPANLVSLVVVCFITSVKLLEVQLVADKTICKLEVDMAACVQMVSLGKMRTKQSVLMTVSVSVNARVKLVKELTMRGTVLGVMLKLRTCGSKLVMVVVQLSIQQSSFVKEVIVIESLEVVVGGEKRLFICSANCRVILVVLAEEITNFMMAVEVYAEHNPDVISPESGLQVAVSIGMRRLVAISCAHCNLVGNCITKYPLFGMWLVGVMFKIMGAVVLTKPGLQDMEQLENMSPTSVTEELDEFAEMSVPMTTMKESVVSAGQGFVTFSILIVIFSIN